MKSLNSIALAAFVSLSFVPVNAFAHVEPGKHVGKTAAGVECAMEAGVTYFDNDAHHPLNERIKITVEGTEFVVGHPPIVDAENAIAYFNHDLFQGIVPTSTGAKALVVDMVHTEEKEGPVRFTLIQNEWKTGKKTSVICEGLAHAK